MNKVLLSLIPALFGALMFTGCAFIPHANADEPHVGSGAPPGPPANAVLVCYPTQRDGQLYLDQCDWFVG